MKINGTKPYLVSLILSMNGITGTIPPALCNFTNAKVLDLSKNNLSGEMPSCWSEDSKLKVLDFSNNNLSGEIHDSICSLHRLESLHLSHNSLSTVFPASLRKCKGLVTLDLSHNKFYGRIPDWLGASMPNLKILNLRSNSFTGYLPSQLSVLSRLHILDISNNNLSGSIPKSFGSFISMGLANDMRRSRNDYYDGYYEENVVLVVKGNEFSFDNILYLVNAIDLSNNSLCGSIPEELADLSALQSLNLSINHLSGEITSKIGKLQELESLDLSKNNISGAIPSSLDSLDFLGCLNLSFNNLSGKIPSGKHLDTFEDPSIYIGNHGLCGHPLTKYCPGEEPEAPAGDDQENDEDKGLSDDALFYLSIGTGFIVGLWTVFITILCKKRWRVAYFRWLDHMYDRVCVAVIINFTRLQRRCSKK